MLMLCLLRTSTMTAYESPDAGVTSWAPWSLADNGVTLRRAVERYDVNVIGLTVANNQHA